MSDKTLKELETKCLRAIVDEAEFKDGSIYLKGDNTWRFFETYLKYGVTGADENERLNNLLEMLTKKKNKIN